MENQGLILFRFFFEWHLNQCELFNVKATLVK